MRQYGFSEMTWPTGTTLKSAPDNLQLCLYATLAQGLSLSLSVTFAHPLLIVCAFSSSILNLLSLLTAPLAAGFSLYLLRKEKGGDTQSDHGVM